MPYCKDDLLMYSHYKCDPVLSELARQCLAQIERAEKAEQQNKVLESALEDMAMVAYGSEYKNRVQFHIEVARCKLDAKSEFADFDNVPESEG